MTPYPGMDMSSLQQLIAQFSPKVDPAQERSKALLTLGLGLLGTRKGQEFDRLGQAGLLAMQQRTKDEEMQRQQQMQNMQAAALAMGLQKEVMATQDAQRMRDLAARYSKPGQEGVGPPNPATGEPAPSAPPSFDYAGYANALAGIDPMKSLTIQQAIRKEQPKVKEIRTQKDPTTNLPVDVIYFEDGTSKTVPYGTASKMQVSDGVAYDPLMVKPGEYVGPKYGPMGVIPATGQAYQQQEGSGKINAVGTAPTRVNVSQSLPPIESEEQKIIGKSRGEAFATLQANARKANDALTSLNAVDQLLSGVDTGPLTPIGMAAAAYAKQLGADVNPNLPAIQAADAISKKLALEARNVGEGGGMPGSLSDSDRRFLVSMVPNIGQTTGGRKLLVEVQRRILTRQQETAAKASAYFRQHHTFDEGFQAEMKAYSEAHPLFADLNVPQTSAPSGGKADWVWDGTKLVPNK